MAPASPAPPAPPAPPATIDLWMSGHQRNDLWQLYETRNFADLWYGARAAGERLRALTLERLYRNRPYPGGPHPDPREPAVFSSQAILSVAAFLVGLRIDATDAGAISGPGRGTSGNASAASAASAGSADYDTDYDEETGQTLPYAWIITYPHEDPQLDSQIDSQIDAQIDPQEDQRPPHIMLRTLHANPRMIEFEIACLIGYWHRDHARLSDPEGPPGAILLPHDPGVTTLLHQYAIALLGLARDCPESWTCHCNRIRARFNAPPPDHPQPTGQLTVDELAEEAKRQRRTTEPRFPYLDRNTWTEE